MLSSKGGVGKTTLSVLLSLATSDILGSTGLLDLDFVNPSTHILLGVDPSKLSYEEYMGINPARVNGLLYFTIAPYTKEHLLPLHGKAARNILWEVLSIVNWKGTKVLFVDTPPGLSDEHLEVLYKLRGVILPLVVSTPSRLSINNVEKLLGMLREIGYTLVFFVENMGNCVLREVADKHGALYAGCLQYIPELEECIGNLNRLKIIAKRTSSIISILLREIA